MKTKHTPAPWATNVDFTGVLYSPHNGLQFHVCILGSGSSTTLTREQEIYNAKLIAAAPDLLKALSDYVSYGDSVIAKEVALKAIKKATL